MTKTVTVTGDEKVIRALHAKGDKAIRLKPVMQDVANFSERQIRGVPVRSGRLAASTHGGPDQLLDVDDGGFQLGSTVRYSRFVFRGTQHMKARPPQINVSAIARKAEHEINATLERA